MFRRRRVPRLRCWPSPIRHLPRRASAPSRDGIDVGVSGIAFANVALLLGLHSAGYAALLRLVMLVVHLFIVVIILQCRGQVAQAIRAPAGREGAAARARNRLAGLWHYLAIALDL